MNDDALPEALEYDLTANGDAMPVRVAEAFHAYYALGPQRSLRKLADGGTFRLASLERWSAHFGWQRRCRDLHDEEMRAARSAAHKEAANLARRRLRNAQLLQEAGLTILARAKIAELGEDGARDMLGDARHMMVEGMRAERLELGEATEHVRTLPPPKPLDEMTDEELDAYIARLEQHPHE
ncbi:MAG: hypothetical protein EI684_06380 [Candidatus Viridilinea halotolerans]|uniref:Uncharacterized protein n=1 Tax=Candidatus Viridilinea halotolerans TaxID=2491704 RepID=A0A426U4A5_9CHLR|nr:MAG: hypothetical protein EI684_06380 [Candidatus Viridilinea halotolerans]